MIRSMIRMTFAVLVLGAVLGIQARAHKDSTPALNNLKGLAQSLALDPSFEPAPPVGKVAVQKPAKKPAKAASIAKSRTIRFDVDDWKECLDWSRMDIGVLIDGERFQFNPSCGFTFRKEFATQKGKQCRVRAGMCSSFSPENAFAVECDDGQSGELGIACDDENDNGVLIEPDWESCAEYGRTMSVRISVQGEDFEFHPDCDWSFSERFETTAGGTCLAESGMCTSWDPKNRFEVTCDNGQEAMVSIPCQLD
ncbi:hypothetical protein ACFL2T_02690 [Elusimicrobiota bacterium]